MAQLDAPATGRHRRARRATRCSVNDANFCAYCGATAGAPVTDDEAFEEPVDAAALPGLPRRASSPISSTACSAASAWPRPARRRPARWAAAPPARRPLIVAVGALLLLLGGFGIAYGFTRDDDGGQGAPARRTVKTGTVTGGVAVPTLTVPTPSRRCRPSPTCPTGTTPDRHRPDRRPTGTDVPTDTTADRPTTETGRRTPTPAVTRRATGRRARTRYAVILSSDDTSSSLRVDHGEEGSRRSAKGFTNAGVLNSDDYFTLNPGYWVLYLGPLRHEVRGPGRAGRGAWRAGYSDAYVRRVAE